MKENLQSLEKDNKRAIEMQGKLREIMERLPPRNIPNDVRKIADSPIASFLGFMGILMIVLCVILVVFKSNWNRAASIAVGVEIVSSVALITWSLYVKKQTTALLKFGRMYNGKVLRVEPLPARINGRTFYRVYVEFTGPDGKRIIGKSTVDNWSVGYFLLARDHGEDVDVIYYPVAFNKVILPMQLASAHRFD